jgi:hypothetical protein
MTSTSVKNAIDTARCAVETSKGKRSKTVIPPSAACTSTSTKAPAPSAASRGPVRRRPTSSSTIKMKVSTATVPAASRWPCSKKMPPTIGGMKVP